METRRKRAARLTGQPRYSLGDILIGWGQTIIIMAVVLAAFVVAVWLVGKIVPG